VEATPAGAARETAQPTDRVIPIFTSTFRSPSRCGAGVSRRVACLQSTSPSSDMRWKGFPHAGAGRGADLKIRPQVRVERARRLGPSDGTGPPSARTSRPWTACARRSTRCSCLGCSALRGTGPPTASSFHRRRLDQFGGVEPRRLDGLPRQATHRGIDSTPPNDTDGLRQPSGSGARGNLLAPHGAGPLPGERCAKTPGLTIRECVPALLPVEPIPLGEVAAQIGPLPLGPRPGAKGIHPAIVMLA
jgi:hypothetical protein